jgi:hypothetical protein
VAEPAVDRPAGVEVPVDAPVAAVGVPGVLALQAATARATAAGARARIRNVRIG